MTPLASCHDNASSSVEVNRSIFLAQYAGGVTLVPSVLGVDRCWLLQQFEAADIKYKLTIDARARNADHYQLLA
jgi:hypothetical protein